MAGVVRIRSPISASETASRRRGEATIFVATINSEVSSDGMAVVVEIQPDTQVIDPELVAILGIFNAGHRIFGRAFFHRGAPQPFEGASRRRDRLLGGTGWGLRTAAQPKVVVIIL